MKCFQSRDPFAYSRYVQNVRVESRSLLKQEGRVKKTKQKTETKTLPIGILVETIVWAETKALNSQQLGRVVFRGLVALTKWQQDEVASGGADGAQEVEHEGFDNLHKCYGSMILESNYLWSLGSLRRWVYSPR